MNVPEVADLFRVSEQTVRNRVNIGKWPAWRDGRQMLFGRQEIAKIRELSTMTAPSRRSAAARRARNKQIRSLPVFRQN
jgi:excisionase family DNA binding protein